jgi:hypothetical protein
MSSWSDEETDDPHYADRRNFYKVEKWSRDGLRVELMLYAGSSLDKARRIFERATNTGRASGSQSGSACGCWTSGHGTKRSSDAGKILPGGCQNQPSGAVAFPGRFGGWQRPPMMFNCSSQVHLKQDKPRERTCPKPEGPNSSGTI